MGDLRNQARVAVHYRVALGRGGRAERARGTTENLSERGTMLSVEIEPPLGAGDVVQLEITLPDSRVVVVGGIVRWASSVLPGMVGIEFEPPMPAALAEHVEQMIAERFRPAGTG